MIETLQIPAAENIVEMGAHRYRGTARCGVYVIANVVNGRVYIGSTVTIAKRLSEHRRDLENGVHQNRHLQSSWNKHGGESFAFWVAEEFQPFGERGYNILRDAGRNRGWVHSQATKEKLRITSRGFKGNDMTRRKLSEAANARLEDLRRPCPADRREKIRRAKRAAYGDLCSRGHALIEAPTHWKGRSRICRTCKPASDRARRVRSR